MLLRNFRDLFALVVWTTTALFYYLYLTNSIPKTEYAGMIIGNLSTLSALVVQFYFRKKPAGESPA